MQNNPAIKYGFFLTILMLIFCFCSCAGAGDYVGATHGYLTVGMKRKFGDGGEKKNFYALDNTTVIAPGELKQTVREKIGLPDKIQSNNEGYEVWIYDSRNIKLFFEEEKFREWAYLK
ncbi:MAG: hypothetical protein WC546_00500 [Candidatus Omnitrophota bacterium]|jgi:hypothetical protein